MSSWLAPVISGAFSLFGSSQQSSANRALAQSQLEAAELAAEASRYNTDANREIAMQNLAAAQERFDQAMGIALEERDAQRLGGADQYGNRTYWHPDKGWVMHLTPRSLNQQDAEQRADLITATELFNLERERINRSADLQRGDQQQANKELMQFNNIERQSPEQIADLLFARGETARADARDALLQGMIRTQSRQGNTSNIPDIFQSAAEQGIKDAGNARIEAELRGLYDAPQMYDTQRANSAQIYSMFRDRADKPFSAVVQPTNGVVSNVASGPTSSALFNSAFGQPVPQQPYLQPDFSAANLAAASGAADYNRRIGGTGITDTLGTLFSNPDVLDALWGAGGNTRTARNTSPTPASRSYPSDNLWGDIDRGTF